MTGKLIAMVTLGAWCCLAAAGCAEKSSRPLDSGGPGADGSLGGDVGVTADGDVGRDAEADSETGPVLDCVPAQCCHPTSCVPSANAPNCQDTGCGASCEPGTLDCGFGFCDVVEGQCQAVMVRDLTCDERVRRSSLEVQAAFAAHGACGDNEDCTLVSDGTQCRGSSQAAVATTGVAAVQAAIAQANQRFCWTFEEDDCPFATPDCAPAEAACQEGSCVVVTTMP